MTATSDSMRECTHCKTTFPATLDHFPRHKIGKYGLHSWCKVCKKEIDTERRNRPDQKARQQAWRDANKEAVKKANSDYRASGYKSTQDVYAWVVRNKEHSLASNRNRNAARRKNEPWYNLKCRISARINKMLKIGGGSKARASTADLLGYSIDDLAKHLEKQFTKGMSWEKLMNGEIHLDHITPVSFFKAIEVDSDEFRACWALSNLQPLWAKDNQEKGDKLLKLI